MSRWDSVTWKQRFYSSVPIPVGDSCMEWAGSKVRGGYGAIWIGPLRRRMLAHRLAYELSHGEIPIGMFVCHRCDNPPCVRPDHLFLGTAADNAADRESKGRGQARSRNRDTHPQTKIDSRGVRDVLGRRSRGESVADIATEHGVARITIYKILQKYNNRTSLER